MKSIFAGITGFSIALSSVVIAIVVCVVGYRIVFNHDGPAAGRINEQQAVANSGSNDPGSADSDLVDNGEAADPVAPALQPPTTMVMVDEDDFRQARDMHETESAELESGSRPGPQKLKSLQLLPDEEKNRIWWEIASIATFHQGEEITYTLKITQAMRIARVYNTSALEIFQLFREGATAPWRTAVAPTEEGDERP